MPEGLQLLSIGLLQDLWTWLPRGHLWSLGLGGLSWGLHKAESTVTRDVEGDSIIKQGSLPHKGSWKVWDLEDTGF